MKNWRRYSLTVLGENRIPQAVAWGTHFSPACCIETGTDLYSYPCIHREFLALKLLFKS